MTSPVLVKCSVVRSGSQPKPISIAPCWAVMGENKPKVGHHLSCTTCTHEVDATCQKPNAE